MIQMIKLVKCLPYPHWFSDASKQWGSHMVCYWVRKWVNSHELPVSLQGKMFSLYDDPVIRDKLQSFVCSNKWAINPEKLIEFSKEKMVPTTA